MHVQGVPCIRALVCQGPPADGNNCDKNPNLYRKLHVKFGIFNIDSKNAEFSIFNQTDMAKLTAIKTEQEYMYIYLSKTADDFASI